ncbi:DUF3099 domain-containing protein [Rhodococcus opacus]|nr:DUF3099 domain-containing protein [Rhodococcus opacus]
MRLSPVSLSRDGVGRYVDASPTVGTRPRPVPITDADASYQDQHRARIQRYLTLMSFRIPSFLASALVYGMTGSPWWATIILGCSLPVPWIAVLIANDRPPRRKQRSSRVDPDPHGTVYPQATTRFKSSY